VVMLIRIPDPARRDEDDAILHPGRWSLGQPRGGRILPCVRAPGP
jgi:hypothetical protein